jgi:CDP-diacylglycerol--serine O-phosphatidyltransferase
MQPRFVGRVSLADVVTVANAALGFLAVLAAFEDPGLGARLLLLAAIADGLDGVVARHVGSSDAGQYLDSLADVASFAVAPAVVVFVVVREGWGVRAPAATPEAALAMGVPALFVAMAVLRLGMFTAYDTRDDYTEGTPTTLAATILGAAVLADVANPNLLIAATALFCYLMVAPIQYPDLLARDAFIMGVSHALAVLIPQWAGMTFPYALLTLALAYLLLAPRFYWRDGLPDPPLLGSKGNA